MSLAILVQLAINGILLGGVYALAALGLSLIFGVSGVLNLAHGEFLMVSGFIVFLVFDRWGINPFLLVALISPLFFLVGYFFEKGLISPLALRKEHVRLASATLVTLGAALMIEDVAAFASQDVQFEKSVDVFLPTLVLGEIYLPSLKLLVFGLVVALIVALMIFLKYTYLGLAVKAVSQNRRGALLNGVNTVRINAIAFGLGTVLAAAAGGLEVIHSYVAPDIGLPLTLKYLVIVVMGGLGSFMGAALGGVIIGLGESFVGFFNPNWGQTVAYLLLVAVLLVRPQGLFGK
ncbi:MAG: branched-chain amino acid ABC transporter permease [SAR324 cluster bacterium]|nr:branched-chain amino acid ABC transporter permease [SAR324 cluster bacterium]